MQRRKQKNTTQACIKYSSSHCPTTRPQSISCSVVSDSCDSMDCSPLGSSVHRILSARILVGSHSLLQGIFPTQGSNPGLLHCRQIPYHLSHQGSPQPLTTDPMTQLLNRTRTHGSCSSAPRVAALWKPCFLQTLSIPVNTLPTDKQL